ncbi:MAG: hypothetical protein Kow0042_14680 [Calditrichia bacterium]
MGLLRVKRSILFAGIFNRASRKKEEYFRPARFHHLFFIFHLSSFIFISCERHSTPVTHRTPQLTLTVEETAVTETWLTLRTRNGLPGDRLQLYRNDSLLAELDPTRPDTTFYDHGLLPATDYRYLARWLRRGEEIVRSSTAATRTMDTTSHNFTWQIDTIGTHSSVLFDVCILNENDVWAVGEIHTPETDRFDSLGNWVPPFNAAHWNGNEWSLERIPVVTAWGTQSRAPLKAVFAFAADDLWVFGEAGSYGYWNGHIWKSEFVDARVGGINKIWGTSSSDIYFVGDNGNITHYDGRSWWRLYSGTEVDLKDVFGFTNPLKIWICGHKNDYSESLLLKVEGLKIKKIWSSNTYSPSLPLEGLVSSVCPLSENYVIVAGGEGIYWMRNGNGSFSRKDTLQLGHFPNRVRGKSINDIFVIGYEGMIWHFNGISWKKYSEIQNFTHHLYSLSIYKDFVVIVGADYSHIQKKSVIYFGQRNSKNRR